MSAHLFDFVLMDLGLNEAEDLEAIKLIRMNPKFKQLPIIGMCDGDPSSFQEASSSAGMDACVGKPFDAAALKEVMNRCADGRMGR